jgi:hypothetical protein
MQEPDAALHFRDGALDGFRSLSTDKLVRIFKRHNFSGCFDDNPNNLICMLHYLKIGLNLFNIHKYYYNIRDYLPHHPVASLNTFIMITFYYGMLFVHIAKLKENAWCIYLMGLYPLTDFAVVIISLLSMRKVMALKNQLEAKHEYKVF